jgi:hypothetical protein
MDIGKTISQAIKIITKPKKALQEINTQSITRTDIIIYLAIIGIPTFIGVLIGYGFFWYVGISFVVPALIGAIIYYIVAIIGIILFGYLVNAFAPTFKSQQNQAQALKLVAFSSTPWLLAGIFYLLPGFLWPVVLLAGLYGLYILYLGLPILMGTPKDQQIPYLIVALVIYIIIMGVIWWITQTIIWNIAISSAGLHVYVPRGRW